MTRKPLKAHLFIMAARWMRQHLKEVREYQEREADKNRSGG